MSGDFDGLAAVQQFFAGRSARWVADLCRSGRLPGAVKVGRTWMIRRSDFERFVGAKAKHLPPTVPTVDEAMADLRRRGVA